MITTQRRLHVARVVLVAIGLAIGASVLGPALLAQPPPTAQEEFVPVTELPPQDQLPAAPLLVTAYAFVWVVLLAYLWSIWRRIVQVERELADVERRADAHERRA